MVRPPLELPFLHTPRLVLEPLLEAHAEPLFAGFADAALYTFLPGDPPATVDALRARFRRLQARAAPDGRDRWLNWASRWRGEGAYAGLVEATVHPDGTADLAYFVFTAHQNRGLGVEAARAVIEHLV